MRLFSNLFNKEKKEPHYTIYVKSKLIGCIGERSTKESVRRVHPVATFKLVKGFCPVCEKNFK